MTRGERTAAVPRGARWLVGSVLCAATTMASLLALAGLIEPGRWSVVAPLAVAGLAGVLAAARATTRSVWAPSLVGLVAAGLGLTMWYGAGAGHVQVLPDLSAVRRAWALGVEGGALVQSSPVPMASTRAAELLVVAGALAVLLAVDALTLGAGAPALAAVPLAAMWMPAVFLGYPASGTALFWTGTGYLFLLALDGPPSRAGGDRARRGAIVVASTTAAVVAALVLAPIIAALPAWAAISLPTFDRGPLGPLELADDLDLRESLGARSGQVILRYTVEGTVKASATTGDWSTADGDRQDVASRATPAPDSDTAGPTPSRTAVPPVLDAHSVGPLRALTLSAYDGRRWHRTERDDLPDLDPTTLLGPVPAGIDTRGAELVVVRLQVGAMRETRLPISISPRKVQILGGGPWRYDAVRDEVIGQQPTEADLQYTLLVLPADLSATDLDDTPVGDPPGDEDYLAVPESEHSDDVRALAGEITADAAGPYQQAVSLQAFLRSTANFTYDTYVAPARTDDAVWDFMQSRRGYCVQFASAMAVMARTLGIPSRVAVGFLPGEPASDGGGEFVVTGHQAHAWPELYFDGVGWVRFEPTPAVQSGTPPIWTDPSQPGSAAVGPSLDELIHDGVLTAPGATTVPTAAASALGRTDGDSARVVAAAGAAGAVGVAALAWFLFARFRRSAALTCEDAWRRVRRELVRRGLAWTDATTPRQAVLVVLGQVAARGGAGLDSTGSAALVHLASAVERDRYAPRPVAPSSAQLHTWILEVLTALDARPAAVRVSGRPGRDAVPTGPRAGT